MSKTLLSAALIAGFGIAAFAPQTASAASSGTITINGSIVSSTCSVLVNGSASPTVTLPTLIDTTLPAGSSGGWTPVNMVLSGCTAIGAYTKVFPYFTGAATIDGSTGYLKNQTGGGSNVQVALSNAASTTGALTLQNASGSQNAGFQSMTANSTFAYFAGYVAAAQATAGGVSTTVQYALNYQ